MKRIGPASTCAVEVVSPVSLIVSAFAPCDDVRPTWTPQLRTDLGNTELLLIDLSGGRVRLGGSIVAQVFGQVGHEAPDLDDPSVMGRFYRALADLRALGGVLAYHDRSDGGLLATVCEMAFAGHVGVTLDADAIVGGRPSGARLPGAPGDVGLLAALFAEELGAVVQVRAVDSARVVDVFGAADLPARVIGRPSDGDRVSIVRGGEVVFEADRVELQRAWSETTWALQSLRDNPDAAREEYDRLRDRADPGISPNLAFDPATDVAAPIYVTRFSL